METISIELTQKLVGQDTTAHGSATPEGIRALFEIDIDVIDDIDRRQIPVDLVLNMQKMALADGEW